MESFRHFKVAFAIIIGIYFLFFTVGAGARHEAGHENQQSGTANFRYKRVSGMGQSDPVSGFLNFSDELGLSSSQFSKLKAARLDYRKKDIRLMANIKITRLNLRNQFSARSFDENKILATADKLGKLTAQKIRLTTETMIKVFKELTPEQIRKTQELHLLKPKKGSGNKMLEGS